MSEQRDTGQGGDVARVLACYHCGQVTEATDDAVANHWRACPTHPAHEVLRDALARAERAEAAAAEWAARESAARGERLVAEAERDEAQVNEAHATHALKQAEAERDAARLDNVLLRGALEDAANAAANNESADAWRIARTALDNKEPSDAE